MKKSPLQIARAAYQPKMPASITGNPVIVEGKATESVADQADIKKLFPNTYGLPIVTFENGDKVRVNLVDHPERVYSVTGFSRYQHFAKLYIKAVD